MTTQSPATETLSAARRRVTRELGGIELPDCFAQATVSAANNALDRQTFAARASRRRLVAKAYRLSGVA